MSKTEDFQSKVTKAMDQLQYAMEHNLHLKGQEGRQEASDLLYKATFYWNFLSEEDRDYCHAAEDAIEDQWEWGN